MRQLDDISDAINMNLSKLWEMKVKVAQLCPTFCNPMDSPQNSLGQNTEVGSLSLLQGIFPTQDLNQGLLYCGQILYQLRNQGSPFYQMPY